MVNLFRRLIHEPSTYYKAARQSSTRTRLLLIFVLGLSVLTLVLLYGPILLYPAIPGKQIRLQHVTGPSVFQIENDRIKLQNEARGTLLQGIAGAAVLLGAYLTARQVQASRDMHTTDQFIRAVEQMGRPDRTTETTLGGIYGLERVARDSAADRRSIGEILTAFIRSAGPGTSDINESVASLGARAPEVQAAVTVLARGKFSDVDLYTEHDVRLLDLSGTDLRKAEIYQLALPAVELHSASLQHAFLVDSDFRYADFSDAEMQGICANQSNFSNISLHFADCSNGHFYNVSFVSAILQGTNFTKADLQSADFRNAYLRESILKGANLFQAKLDGAELNGAIADEGTIWPTNFDPDAAGVLIESDPDYAENT